MFVNPFDVDGNWYKANLHTHTHASDGQASLEERIRQYAENGYSVLAITDHGVGSDAAHLSTPDFLVLDGIEVAVRQPDRGAFYHIVCLNVPSDATVPATDNPNDVTAWAREEGGESLLAHPYWSGNTAHQLAAVRRCVAIEVHNATCRRIGKPTSSVHWDDLLDMGIRVPAIAVDDAHAAVAPCLDLFGGWGMFRMESLCAGAVMEALRTGCYYSSSGAGIADFRVQGAVASVRCPGARQIHLIGANCHGSSRYAPAGQTISEAEAEVTEAWKYVRAEVVDAAGGRAWTNPIFL